MMGMQGSGRNLCYLKPIMKVTFTNRYEPICALLSDLQAYWSLDS